MTLQTLRSLPKLLSFRFSHYQRMFASGHSDGKVCMIKLDAKAPLCPLWIHSWVRNTLATGPASCRMLSCTQISPHSNKKRKIAGLQRSWMAFSAGVSVYCRGTRQPTNKFKITTPTVQSPSQFGAHICDHIGRVLPHCAASLHEQALHGCAAPVTSVTQKHCQHSMIGWWGSYLRAVHRHLD